MDAYDYLNKIPAKPTTYKGINFKSKLEAQYASFFDAIDIPWEYEKDIVSLPDGTTYVSDFTINTGYNYGLYEMKPKGVTSKKFIAAKKVIEEAYNEHSWRYSEWDYPTETFLLQGSLYDHFLTNFNNLHFCFRCGLPELREGAGVGIGELWQYCLHCDCTTPSDKHELYYSTATKLYYYSHEGWLYITESEYDKFMKKLRKAAENILWPHDEEETTAK